MKQFETGKTYRMRSICDHECVWEFKVKARTAQMITLADEKGKELKCRICKQVSEWNKAETVYPLGRYSMAPSLTARHRQTGPGKPDLVAAARQRRK